MRMVALIIAQIIIKNGKKGKTKSSSVMYARKFSSKIRR